MVSLEVTVAAPVHPSLHSEPDVYGTGGALNRSASRRVNRWVSQALSRGIGIPGGTPEELWIRCWLGGVRYHRKLPTSSGLISSTRVD
jgi:hypothetical protein